jgi:hypothetical protein
VVVGLVVGVPVVGVPVVGVPVGLSVVIEPVVVVLDPVELSVGGGAFVEQAENRRTSMTLARLGRCTFRG